MLAVLLLLAGCRDDGSEGVPAPDIQGALTDEQLRRADELVSVFENSTTEIQYAYAEDLGDGRGITSGRAGFTTATCDALEVVERYTAQDPDNGLAPFVPELERLCRTGSDDTTGLPADEYVAAWTAAAEDPAFRSVQDGVVEEEYYDPALAIADEVGLTTALARAALYDTAIQHGVGDDPDGLAALVERTSAAVGTPEEAGEAAWLDAFLDQRTATLLAPADEATTEAWSESVSRVECLRSIAAAGNLDLDGPIRCTVYGDPFTIR